MQVADGADRLDAGERPEAIQQAPRVDARLVALALRTAERELDPDLWVLETKTMDRQLALMRLPQQLSAFVLSAFGALALALAAVGLYCLVSYSVARRTDEIGIRMALGANSSRVVRVLGAGGLQLVVIGGALGLTLAVVATRLLGGLLFEVDALDPLTFVGVPVVLGAAALLAAYLPRPAAPAESIPSRRSEPIECRRPARHGSTASCSSRTVTIPCRLRDGLGTAGRHRLHDGWTSLSAGEVWSGRTLVAGGRVNLAGHAFDLVDAGTPWTGARRPSSTSLATRQRDPVHVDVLRVLELVDPSWSALRRLEQPDMERLDGGKELFEGVRRLVRLDAGLAFERGLVGSVNDQHPRDHGNGHGPERGGHRFLWRIGKPLPPCFEYRVPRLRMDALEEHHVGDVVRMPFPYRDGAEHLLLFLPT